MRYVQSAAVVAGLMLCAGHASAHAFLKTANPAVGSLITQAPAQLVIDFTEGVEPAFSSITVQDASGARLDTGDVHTTGDDAHLAVALKPLPPGTYKVVWHATATDTHKTQGDYRFTVKP